MRWALGLPQLRYVAVDRFEQVLRYPPRQPIAMSAASGAGGHTCYPLPTSHRPLPLALTTRCPLLSACSPPPAARRSLITARYPLPAARYLLLTACCLLPATRCLLPTARCLLTSLPAAHCLLTSLPADRAACCSLPTVRWLLISLPAAHCPQLAAGCPLLAACCSLLVAMPLHSPSTPHADRTLLVRCVCCGIILDHTLRHPSCRTTSSSNVATSTQKSMPMLSARAKLS